MVIAYSDSMLSYWVTICKNLTSSIINGFHCFYIYIIYIFYIFTPFYVKSFSIQLLYPFPAVPLVSDERLSGHETDHEMISKLENSREIWTFWTFDPYTIPHPKWFDIYCLTDSMLYYPLLTVDQKFTYKIR